MSRGSGVQGFESREEGCSRIGENRDVARIESYRTLDDGSKVRFIVYYWFVGANQYTSSHYVRTLSDMKDRLVYGSGQRWSYFSVQGAVSGDLFPSGRTVEETDAVLEKFAAGVFRSCVRSDRLE